ncbi:hypothetical protein BT96DRAFT_872295 [Gymnopus androsaceus JB14]|uniref:Carbohydrate esterase family 16 protein n=1 Tax=Gymnopus androsaceus JB14 TaxID=1447944 RepID=A0A6A4IGD6_9AGAR|nr:hypothetical protein BT96DRAFT_872295 [Gymnopus androsaceus JB14]
MSYPSFTNDKSTVVQVSDNWPAINGISRMVIFGDSYSSVGYRGRPGLTVPRAEKPLGVDFPGSSLEMWNEDGTPNWVGHLITKYMPGPRYKPDQGEQDEGYADDPLLIYDYAIGGNTINGVASQVKEQFLGPNCVGTKPQWAPWESNNTLFVTWVGINDCAFNKEHENNISKLFDLQEQLYQAGARNFLFIDVPPIHRSPAISPRRAEMASVSYHNWNDGLRSGLNTFAQSHQDTSLFLFSSYATFDHMLDNYKDYGFTQEDVREPFRAIWCDQLHPKSKVHDILAFNIYSFLSNIPKI